jgi:flavin reductase (DIM6/NTAB) family NADH-FMN oxidoreductase RutF
MTKVEVDYRDFLRPITEALWSGGLLLVTVDRAGRPNPMTIGWAALGPMWGRSVFVALVRRSRYTYELLEDAGDFTVNMLPRKLAPALKHCGSRSGRQHDKLAEQELTPVPGEKVKSPTIAEAVLCLECRVVHKSEMAPEWLDPEIQRSAYPSGDYHRLYFGQIVAAYADPDRVGK